MNNLMGNSTLPNCQKACKSLWNLLRSGICFQQPLRSRYIMLFSCPSYNTALLPGAKHWIHILSHHLSYKKELSEQFHINLFLAPSFPIFIDLKLLRSVGIFKLRLSSFVYESVNMVAPDFFQSLFSLSSTVRYHNDHMTIHSW